MQQCFVSTRCRAQWVVAVLALAGVAAQAQINVVNQPYRAGAQAPAMAQASSPAGVPDLGIAPFAPASPYGTPQSVQPMQRMQGPAALPRMAEQPRVWEVLLTDGNLQRALSRWARADGRPVLWEAPKEFPAVYARYIGTYAQAFEQVMVDTAHSSYQLHACEYDNVIRVLHTSQSCFR